MPQDNSRPALGLDPRFIEYRQARSDLELGLNAPLGSRERFLAARNHFIECLAENAPSTQARRQMMRALIDDGHPLGLVLGLFAATEEEAEFVRDDAPVVPESDDQAEQLRAMPYQAYLRTKHWRAVRADALRRAGYQCQLCWRKDELQVHHRDKAAYARRGCERPTDVTVLCEHHHELISKEGAA